jgi:hypothetical protein
LMVRYVCEMRQLATPATVATLALSLSVIGCGRVHFDAVQSKDGEFADSRPGDFDGAMGPDAPSRWRQRRKIEFGNGARAENLLGIPVLISIPVSLGVRSDLADLHFFDSDNTTELPFEIEALITASPGLVWVRVPQVDALSDVDFIWMYFDDPTPILNEQATAVWDNNFAAVFHFGSRENSTGVTLSISSLATSGMQGVGIMNSGGQSFSGGGAKILGNNAAFQTPEMTVSVWGRTNAVTSVAQHFVSRSTTEIAGPAPTANDFSLSSYMDDCYSETVRVGRALDLTTQAPCEATTGLRFQAVTLGTTSTTAYVEGQLVRTTTGLPARATSARPILIGADIDDGGTFPNVGFLNGFVDEVRIENVARSALWINAQFAIGNGTFAVIVP